MAEAAEVVVESAATPEAQAAATKLGWIPPERYKGDPERFVDADAFIERGETVLPIVKKQLETTRAELATERTARQQIEASLKAAEKAIEQIELRHSVATQKAVERAKADVKAQLELASEAGDHKGVAELTEQMVELNAAEKEAKADATKTPPKDEAKPYVPSAEIKAWNDDNPWYGTDEERTKMANRAAWLLRVAGFSGSETEFMNQVKKDVDAAWEKSHPQQQDKVSGGRNGSNEDGPRGGAGGKTFNSLPADAKAQCKADAKQFVGPNKSYKTEAEWNAAFTKLYFEQE